MSNFSNFRDRIAAELERADEAAPAFKEARAFLVAAAEGVEQHVRTQHSDADVKVELGHRTRLGQQFNIVLSIPEPKFKEVLFRAYLPPEGYPVSLDLFGEDITSCDDRAQMEREIISFIADHIRPRLRMLG